MKIKISLAITAFTLALSCSAAAAGEPEAFNGITVFSDQVVAADDEAIILPDRPGKGMVEGASAGGFRSGEMDDAPYNGVTTFSDHVIAEDDAAILPAERPAGVPAMEEGSAAGGLRSLDETASGNGITTFRVGPVVTDY